MTIVVVFDNVSFIDDWAEQGNIVLPVFIIYNHVPIFQSQPVVLTVSNMYATWADIKIMRDLHHLIFNEIEVKYTTFLFLSHTANWLLHI